MSSNPQKLKKKKKKKAIIYKEEWFLEFISEIKNLTFQYPKLSVGILFGFLELGVVFIFDIH